MSDPAKSTKQAEGIEVLHYVPSYACVVNKPHDLRIDGDVPQSAEKLVQNEMKRLDPEHFTNPTGDFGVRLVHQLDFPTSGVLCFGLTKKSASELHSLFSHRSAKKTYLALVWGHMIEDRYVFTSPIYESPGDTVRVFLGTPENPGRCAVTHAYVGYRAFYAGKPVTYVVLRPTTGRRHQLRVHLASAGYPIVGDINYCDERLAPRMMLHAWSLVLPSPAQPLYVTSKDPFKHLLNEPTPSSLIPQGLDMEMPEMLLPAELPEFQKDFALAGVLPYCVVAGELRFLLSTQPRRDWLPAKPHKPAATEEGEDRRGGEEAKFEPRKKQKLDPALTKSEVIAAGDEGKLQSVKGSNVACFVTTRSESEVDSFLCAARALFVETMFAFAPNTDLSQLSADNHAFMAYSNRLRSGEGCIALNFRSQFSDQEQPAPAPQEQQQKQQGKKQKQQVAPKRPWPRAVIYVAPVPYIAAEALNSRMTAYGAASKAKRKELAGISLQPGSRAFSWVSLETLLGEQKQSDNRKLPLEPLLARLSSVATEFQERVRGMVSTAASTEAKEVSPASPQQAEPSPPLPPVVPGVEGEGLPLASEVAPPLPSAIFPLPLCLELRARAIKDAQINYVTLNVP